MADIRVRNAGTFTKFKPFLSGKPITCGGHVTHGHIVVTLSALDYPESTEEVLVKAVQTSMSEDEALKLAKNLTDMVERLRKLRDEA